MLPICQLAGGFRDFESWRMDCRYGAARRQIFVGARLPRLDFRIARGSRATRKLKGGSSDEPDVERESLPLSSGNVFVRRD